MNRIFFIACSLFLFGKIAAAQDTSNIMKQLEDQRNMGQPGYATPPFKYTRIVDGHSVVTLPKRVLDVRISHRFGPISSGLYNFFGLDNATMRLGFDYGITNKIMVGVGHSTYQKTYDGFIKISLTQQEGISGNHLVSVAAVATMAINTLKQFDSVSTPFGDRTSYVYQLLIARKISRGFSLQLMPTYVVTDPISFKHLVKNVVAIGVGAAHRVSKRMNINAEYYYQFPDDKAPGSHNVLSFGVDIGTGGHVFQLHFTNSTGLTEKSFITETTGRWDKSDILFGFNISRVFQLK
jgi:Membrane bound beta barrel domain (DUF5777)